MNKTNNGLLNDLTEQGRGSIAFDINLLQNQFGILSDFCESSGIEVEKICHDHKNKKDSDGYKLAEALYKTESEKLIKKYYSATTSYLIELTLHECSWNYQNIFWSITEFVEKRGIKNILDYGGGAGGLSIYLDKKGIRCEYADVPGKTWNYAGYRFKREGLEIPQLTEDALGEMGASYDLIVSLDCLEHLKDLPKYIALFNRSLNENGYLLVRSAFFGEGPHLSSTYKYQCLNTFNKMLRDNGFVFMGQSVTRMKKNFLVPSFVLRLLPERSSSGRSLVYKKEVF